MGDWNGQVSRIGIVMQHGGEREGFPNWTRPVLNGWIGSQIGKVSDLMRAANAPIPGNLSSVRPSKTVVSRELIHTLGRTLGGYQRKTYEYIVDQDVNGFTDSVSWKCRITEIRRDSQQGKDRGATSAHFIIKEIVVTDVDGGVSKYNIDKRILHTIDGWGSRADHIAEGVVSHPKRINKVRFHGILYHGHEKYHHRPGGSVNPGGVLSTKAFGVGVSYGSPPIPWGAVNTRIDRTAIYDRVHESPVIGNPIETWPENAIIRTYVPPPPPPPPMPEGMGCVTVTNGIMTTKDNFKIRAPGALYYADINQLFLIHSGHSLTKWGRFIRHVVYVRTGGNDHDPTSGRLLYRIEPNSGNSATRVGRMDSYPIYHIWTKP